MGGAEQDASMEDALDPLRRRLGLAVSAASLDRRVEGRLVSARGVSLTALLPGARVGEVVRVARPAGEALRAEVVAFDEDRAVLLPLGDSRALGSDDPVCRVSEALEVACGDGLLGRVVDGLGEVRDGRGPLVGPTVPRALDGPAPDPLRRLPVDAPFATGVRVLDACVPLGWGQRVGLFAEAGAGKSSLLGAIVRGAEADVVVAALVGERGVEVADFVRSQRESAAAARTVVVASTSDEPALLRLRAAFTATAIAEHFRDRGRRVLLVVDSLTRVARAQREVGLSAGEPATRGGLPPSVLGLLPRLVERAGRTPEGSITALYTVLLEGGDLNEPIADAARSVLDGHVVLSAELLARGRTPPIDVLRSVSRVSHAVTDATQRAAAATLRAWLHAVESRRELIALGAYTPGGDATTDAALARWPEVMAFLQQPTEAHVPREEAVRALAALVATATPTRGR
jgi:FliI/YscN family ATPase